jgi:hypothetical protein
VAASRWLAGRSATADEGLVRLAERYLAAFGPASLADMGRWSGIPRGELRGAVERLGERIVRYEDEGGRVLLDLAGAPLPSAGTPAPPRLLPMWDSVILAFDDRRRILPEPYRREVIKTNGDTLPTILVDGRVAGVWQTRPAKDGVRITWHPFEPLSREAETGLAREARRLERFLAPLDRSTYSFYARHFAALIGDTLRDGSE